jgi:hypothetical protein
VENLKNLIKVIYAPSAAFEDLRDRKGGWVLPMFVLIAVTLLVLWLQMPLILEESKAAFAKQGITGEMPPIVEISSYVGGGISVVAMLFIGALLLLLVNLIVRGEAKYMQLVKVILFSSVPTMLQGLVIGALARSTEATSVKDIALNAGALFSEKSGFMYQLATLLDPFVIWGIVLMVMGTAIMARKPKATVAVWIVGGWLLFAILGFLIGNAFSGMGQ